MILDYRTIRELAPREILFRYLSRVIKLIILGIISFLLVAGVLSLGESPVLIKITLIVVMIVTFFKFLNRYLDYKTWQYINHYDVYSYIYNSMPDDLKWARINADEISEEGIKREQAKLKKLKRDSNFGNANNSEEIKNAETMIAYLKSILLLERNGIFFRLQVYFGHRVTLYDKYPFRFSVLKIIKVILKSLFTSSFIETSKHEPFKNQETTRSVKSKND